MLDREKVRKEVESWESFSYNYNLGDRPMRHDELGIRLVDGKWELYRSFERGGYNVIDTFDKESDACEALLYYLRSEKRRQERYRKFREQELLKHKERLKRKEELKKQNTDEYRTVDFFDWSE